MCRLCVPLFCVLLLLRAPAPARADLPLDSRPVATAATQPASAPTTQPVPASDDTLRRELEELRRRLESLESLHAEEHQRDQQRIAELEKQVSELRDPDLENQRRAAMARQIAEMQASMNGTSQPSSRSQPAASQPGGAEDELSALIAGAQPTTPESKSTGGAIGALQSAIQSFNPDISLNGDFLAAYSNREGGKLDDEFLFRELEIGFSGAVDPYTRADVIATIGKEPDDSEYSIDLEEAYLTYLQLPYNLQARFGKFRAEFGRANPIHLHALPWVDYPFVIRRYFGDEGLSGTGAEVSWLVPNPWDQYIALIYEVFNNDNDTLFAGQESDDFTHLMRLKTFRDLSADSTLEYGGSIATAPNTQGHGSHRSTIEGLDLTYRWKPKNAGLYRSFLLQNEVMFAQADIIGGQESTWGMYSAAEYQFARQWKLGLRFDDAQLPGSSSHYERGYSTYLTFLQSEFVFWRLAYLYTDRNFREDGNGDDSQIFLQLNFTLGAHPAHRY